MTRVAALALDPATYRRHELHAEGRAFVEKNCYVDICIEVIHALGLEAIAAAPFALAVDFEGDHWTFFKPPHAEMWDLFGIDVQELNVWRGILEQSVEYLASGRLVQTEADAFHLPDTKGTDYRTNHVKSSIVIADLDVERRRLGYFHNAGYFALEGEDFERLFRVGAPPDPTFLPLFAELIRVDRLRRLAPAELAARSRELLRRHVARLPARNPVARFAERFPADLARLEGEGLARYHAWAFATLRQLGAALEMGGLYLEWLGRQGDAGLEGAAAACGRISSAAKALILKGARAVNFKRKVDLGDLLGSMVAAWDEAMGPLRERYPS